MFHEREGRFLAARYGWWGSCSLFFNRTCGSLAVVIAKKEVVGGDQVVRVPAAADTDPGNFSWECQVAFAYL